MKRRDGQAGTLIGRVLQAVFLFVLTVFLLLLLGFGALAFRLSLGPLQMPFLATQMANAVSGAGVKIRITSAALAWNAYKHGGGAPLFLQLGGITARNAGGVEIAAIPDARLIFLPGALLGSEAPILVNSADMHFSGATAAVGLRAAIHLNIGFTLSRADLLVTLGPGRLGTGGESESITGGGFSLHIKTRHAELADGRLALTQSGGSAPNLTFSGRFQKIRDWSGALTLAADRVNAADLPAYWPAGLAPQTRVWVLDNIKSGSAENAAFVFGVSAPAGLTALSLNSATGSFQASNLTLTWIPGAVPITGLSGRLQLLDADDILITASGAKLGGMALQTGTMRITGISQADQDATVKVTLAGGIPAAIAVLNAPPLSLLAKAPAELAAATGSASVDVSAALPLEARLRLPAVTLLVAARLSDVAVPTPVVGIAFTGGTLRLNATTKDLTADGSAQLAGEPARLSVAANFRTVQVLQKFRLQTAIGPEGLHRLGLDAQSDFAEPVSGVVPVDLRVDAGAGDALDATLNADLTAAKLGLPVFGWAKQAGAAAQILLQGRIAGDGQIEISNITAQAPGLAVDGRWQAGRLDLREARIGRSSAAGSIAPPTARRGFWQVALRGPALDVRAILNAPHSKQEAAAEQPAPGPPSGPAWRANLDFTTLHLAADPAPALQNFTFAGNGEGGSVLAANAHAADEADSNPAQDAAGPPVNLAVTPVSADGDRRRFHLDAADGGFLLRSLAAFNDLQGGALVVDGDYGGGDAFTGSASLTKFRLLQAPALGKVLQALTIYGAAEAASGPGLSFTRLVAPFSIARQKLTLKDARAYSASLGFTAAGTVGLADGATNISATIIPAYALNALPGKIPLLGKLFSAEKGGGLFAVRAKITGTLNNPKVAVNPLSALTPGVLRNVFGAAPK